MLTWPPVLWFVRSMCPSMMTYSGLCHPTHSVLFPIGFCSDHRRTVGPKQLKKKIIWYWYFFCNNHSLSSVGTNYVSDIWAYQLEIAKINIFFIQDSVDENSKQPLCFAVLLSSARLLDARTVHWWPTKFISFRQPSHNVQFARLLKWPGRKKKIYWLFYNSLILIRTNWVLPGIQ